MGADAGLTGFESHSDETLIKIQAMLLRGLDRVAASIQEGSFTKTGFKGAASVAEAGGFTVAMLKGVSLELAKRELPSVAIDLDRTIREAQNGH